MASNTFDVARMEALKAYAHLEHELCLLLKAIIPVQAPIASAIFYSISNTRARYKIINAVLEINYPDTFAKPWPKLETWLGARDTARNHIIHWGQDTRLVVASTEAWNPKTGQTTPVVIQQEVGSLSNSARRWREKSGDELVYTETEIRNETAKVQAMEIIIRRYNSSIYYPERWPWTEKFQQPLADRSLEEFLQRLDDIKPPSQPRSSSQ